LRKAFSAVAGKAATESLRYRGWLTSGERSEIVRSRKAISRCVIGTMMTTPITLKMVWKTASFRA
jgi:hypothetical protein